MLLVSHPSDSAKVAASVSLPNKKSTYGIVSVKVFLKGGTWANQQAQLKLQACKFAQLTGPTALPMGGVNALRRPYGCYVSAARQSTTVLSNYMQHRSKNLVSYTCNRTTHVMHKQG